MLFSCRCIESTPINGVTPHALLIAWPGLLGCMSLVADWATGVRGEELAGDELLAALEVAHQVATKAAGEYHAEVSGPLAACWAVYHLANAALISATANDAPATLGDARRSAVLAARLARRAGVALTSDALEHQERLRQAVLQPPLA